MLDERDDALGHESSRPDRLAAPGHFDDLDHAAARRHLDATAGARGLDLVGLDAVADVDHDLHAIASHGVHDRHRRRRTPG